MVCVVGFVSVSFVLTLRVMVSAVRSIFMLSLSTASLISWLSSLDSPPCSVTVYLVGDLRGNLRLRIGS